MALSAVKGKLERVLDKNLQDLVRGIRKHASDESKYVGECLDEIKNELKQDSFTVKANAVNKLIYIQMLGYDVSWSLFNVIEVMSSPKFTFKRIGYLAASQNFNSGTEVLVLATNLIRKDLACSDMYDTGVSLSGLACFINTELAINIYSNILNLINSQRPYLRKKAVLLLYKVFLHYPEALAICFPQLKEKLDDPDPGVQSAAVNVICELARRNPKSYLSLSPVFFKLMTTSTNNWVLIKIIKLFSTLTPLEPRLGKKLIGPLTNLIHSTSAMSLLYECINTTVSVLISISSGIPNHQASIQLCVQKLRILIEDSDQNLKYLGLLAMRKILLHHPETVQPHKDLILHCLDDKDESIRLRALHLLHCMVSKSNLMDIVKHLILHIRNFSSGTHYRNELLAKVVQITSQDNYQLITSFEWYVSVLVELARIDNIRNGQLIAAQLMDVAIRVPTVRAFCVEQMAILLDIYESLIREGKQNSIQETLSAAVWICGEYANHLSDPQQALESILLVAHKTPNLSNPILAILLLNAFKIFRMSMLQSTIKLFNQLLSSDANVEVESDSSLSTNWRHVQTEDFLNQSLELCNISHEKFGLFLQSADLEVQERAVTIHQLFNYIIKRLTKIRTLLTNNSDDHSSIVAVGLKSQASGPKQMTDISMVHERFQHFLQHTDPTARDTINMVLDSILNLVLELDTFFQGEINPVAPKAQHSVPIPNGLNLEKWINPPMDSTNLMHQRKKVSRSNKPVVMDANDIFCKSENLNSTPQMTAEEMEEVRSLRLHRQLNNPNYLKVTNDAKPTQPSDDATAKRLLPDEQLPAGIPCNHDKTKSSVGDARPAARTLANPDQFMRTLSENAQLQPSIQSDADDKVRIKKLGRSRKKAHSAKSNHSKKRPVPEPNQLLIDVNDQASVDHVVRIEYDMPEGMVITDMQPNESDFIDPNDPHTRLQLVLDNMMNNGDQKHTSTDNAQTTVHNNDDTKEYNEAQTRQVLRNNNNNNNNNNNCYYHNDESPSNDANLVKIDEFCKQTSKSSNHCDPTSIIQHKPPPTPTTPASTDAVTSKFLANPISAEQFISLLSPVGSRLNSDRSFKIRCPSLTALINKLKRKNDSPDEGKRISLLLSDKSRIFEQLLHYLNDQLPCLVVESIQSKFAASLYTTCVVDVSPVCILLKLSFDTGCVKLDIRCTNESISDLCTAQLKALIKKHTIRL